MDEDTRPPYYPEVADRYNSGEMIKDIASTLGMSGYLLSYHMRRHGFKFDRRYRTLTQKQVLEIVDRYTNGESTPTLAKEYPCNSDTILRVLRDNNVAIKTKRELKFYKDYTINEYAFLDIQEESAAYFYGWILTDGCLSRDTISIEVQQGDIEVLEKYKAYLKSSNKIYKRSRKDKRTGNTYYSATFNFSHKPIQDRLTLLGLSERKSTNEVCPPELEMNRHFWRGVVEGDGSISSDRYRVQLCGSKQLVEKFADYARSLHETVAPNYHNRKGLYTVSISGKEETSAILSDMYRDATLTLSRKYKTYLENYCG